MQSNKLIKYFSIWCLILVLVSCGGGGSSSSPSTTGSTGSDQGTDTGFVAANVLPITINDPSYPNKPTVSVTVCTPGTNLCQTINNILLDTGSSGLRIFKNIPLTLSLPQITINAAPLAECIAYADGSGEWGPVGTADVVLGGLKATNVPIQIIDATYFAAAIPSVCRQPNVTGLDNNPSTAGFNGILGVGLFVQDCGTFCANRTRHGMYYTCSGTSCTGVAVRLSSQVPNPVTRLSQHNNGVIVTLPSIALGGSRSVNGQLILGIGTSSNNQPMSVTMYPADSYGEFITSFNGSTLPSSFIDSGSNGLFFYAPSSLLTVCSSPYIGWYCPQTMQSFTATNSGASGTPSGVVNFKIENASTLFSNQQNSAFAELGGTAVYGTGFDWGLPFFFGRSVYVGIEGGTSTLGTGPYWAY